VIKLYYEESP